jgi:hypothetical protein
MQEVISTNKPSVHVRSLRAWSDEEMEKYSYGCCMYFALAVHDNTGWQLEVLLEPEEDLISHAYLRLPDGRTFDIVGLDGADDYDVENNPRARQVSRDELVSLFSIGIEDYAETKMAEATFRQIYEPTLKSTVENIIPAPHKRMGLMR